MSLIEGFTRQEVIGLTGLTSENLAYFARIGMIIPRKFGNTKKPTCIYSWEQVLELLAIKNLRRKVSLQTIRSIICFLEKEGFTNSLRDKHLVVVGDRVFWVEDSWKDFPEKVLTVARNRSRPGEYVFAFMTTINDLIEITWHNAKKSNKIDFDSFQERAKAKPYTEAA